MKMHWCTGKLNLAGQGFTINVIDKHDPISWPEAQVLMALHGGENLFELRPCGVSEADPRREKDRLLAKYDRVVEAVFPGYSPRMELLMPGEPDNQQWLDGEGQPSNGNGNGHPIQEPPSPQPIPPQPEPDEDEEGETAAPAGPAVFKPGKHQPPHKGL